MVYNHKASFHISHVTNVQQNLQIVRNLFQNFMNINNLHVLSKPGGGG